MKIEFVNSEDVAQFSEFPINGGAMFKVFGFLIAAATTLSFTPVMATCSSYPNTFSNGTTADAGQVNANFACAAKTSGDTMDSTTFTGTTTFSGPLTTSSTITPSTTNGIVGTTSGNNANAGSVGEYISATNSSGTTISNGTTGNAVSMSLTAGDWDVGGVIDVQTGGSSINHIASSISTVSGTEDTTLGRFFDLFGGSGGYNAIILPAPTTRMSISTTTTVYMTVLANSGASNFTAYGYLWARRVR